MIIYAVAKPFNFIHKLWIRNLGIKIEIKNKGKDKGNEGYTQGKKAENIFPAALNEDEKNGSRKREKSYETQYCKIHFLKQ